MAKKQNTRPAPNTAPAKPYARNINSGSSGSSTTTDSKPATDWFSLPYLCIALGVISFLLYFNTLSHGYILDDVMVLKDNVLVKQGFKGIPELFTTPHMRGYLIIPNDLYRPLSLVMFAIEYQLFGLSPAVNHFFNVLTFAGCVIMLFLFLNKFFDGKKTAIAFIAAMIFAVHPIHTEVVANIKSRDELMCYFFAFWSLNLFMNYMKSGKMLQLALGCLVLFLSFISKETVITFLAVIPVLFFIYCNENKQRAIFITGGSVAVFAVFMVIRTVILNKFNANQPAAVDFMDNALAGAPTITSKIATEFFILGKYLKLMFIPYPLLANYSFNSIPFAGFGDIGALLSIAAYVALAYFGISRFVKNKKDPWAFAILLYLATLSLFSNFPFLMGAEMAERFAFFASTGFCLAVALAIEQWIIKTDATDIMSLKATKTLAILVPVVLVFGGMSFARNTDWKDEYTLYKTDVEKSPEDSRLYQYLATAIAENMYPEEPDSNKRKAMDKESIGYLQKALAIYPDFAEAHVELGRLYERAHMYDSAVAQDTRALALKPFNATANNNMGSVMITLGRYQESIPYLKRSIQGNPNFKFVYLNLARAYKQIKQYDSAAPAYIQLLAFDPGYVDGQKELATVYFLQQKYDSAGVHFKIVCDLMPNDPDAFNNLGAVYLNGKNFAKAIDQFKKTIALNPNYMNAYSNLGRCYYFTQQYQPAIDIFNKELSIDPKNGRDVPYIALSYQKMGKMDLARQYEAVAKKIYADFKLE
jgi:tetratricopeptide (TPR) repeat protein